MLKINRSDAEQSVLSAVAGHVFQMFPIKKAAEAMDSACRFIREGK